MTTQLLPQQTPNPDGVVRSVPVSSGATKWLRYLRRRLIGVMAVLVTVVLLTFMIVQWVPGDPARNIVGITADPAQVQQVRVELGLTRPLWAQFGHYVTHLAQGDLGTSFIDQQPVTEMLTQRLPLTAQLAGYALFLVVVLGFGIGITIGVLQRNQRGRSATAAFTGGSSLLGAIDRKSVV